MIEKFSEEAIDRIKEISKTAKEERREMALHLCKKKGKIIPGKTYKGGFTEVEEPEIAKCEEGEFVGGIHTHPPPTRFRPSPPAFTEADLAGFSKRIKKARKPVFSCILVPRAKTNEHFVPEKNIYCIKSEMGPEEIKKREKEIKEAKAKGKYFPRYLIHKEFLSDSRMSIDDLQKKREMKFRPTSMVSILPP